MNNQIENMPDKMVSLCKEAKRMEEDALYSSKGHFNDEEFWIVFILRMSQNCIYFCVASFFIIWFNNFSKSK